MGNTRQGPGQPIAVLPMSYRKGAVAHERAELVLARHAVNGDVDDDAAHDFVHFEDFVGVAF